MSVSSFNSYRLPALFKLGLAGQERKRGSIYSNAMNVFLLVTCPLLEESISR